MENIILIMVGIFCIVLGLLLDDMYRKFKNKKSDVDNDLDDKISYAEYEESTKPKPKNINNLSYTKAYEYIADYFYKVGLIKTPIAKLDDKGDRENFDIEFVFVLAKQISKDYGTSYVFKKSLGDYHYSIHFKSKFDDLFAEMKSIYNDIAQNEEYFEMVFKYSIKHEFNVYYNKSSLRKDVYLKSLTDLRLFRYIEESDLTILDDYVINENQTAKNIFLRTRPIVKPPTLPLQIDEKTCIVTKSHSTSNDPTIDIINKYL